MTNSTFLEGEGSMVSLGAVKDGACGRPPIHRIGANKVQHCFINRTCALDNVLDCISFLVAIRLLLPTVASILEYWTALADKVKQQVHSCHYGAGAGGAYTGVLTLFTKEERV